MANLTRGERFKDARKVFNRHGDQTMNEVQNATGVSASLIADLENDDKDRRANYIDVATLAKHYGVTTDWLCGLSDDHHPVPCASNELGLAENSIYFLKSLNNARSAFDEHNKIIRENWKSNEANQSAQSVREAISELKILDSFRNDDRALWDYAYICSHFGLSLVDSLLSAIQNNYRIIVDFNDLCEADPTTWKHEDELLSYDDYIRFKSGEISKTIDRDLVDRFRDRRESAIYYDHVTEEYGYLYRYED